MVELNQQQSSVRCKPSRRAALVPVAIFLVLTILTMLLEVAEGGRKQPKSRRRIKKSRAGVGKDFSEFLMVIGAIMTCVIAPVFAFFLRSIYKDPASPEIARACWNAVKDKLFSYLGGKQPVASDPTVNGSGLAASSSSHGPARSRRGIYAGGDTGVNDYTSAGIAERNGHDVTSRALRRGTADASTPRTNRGTAVTDRAHRVRSMDESFSRKDYYEPSWEPPLLLHQQRSNRTIVRPGHRKRGVGREESQGRLGSNAVAPHFSGALEPRWEEERPREVEDRGSETATFWEPGFRSSRLPGSPIWRQAEEGGDTYDSVPRAQAGAGVFEGEKAFFSSSFESRPQGMKELNPYVDDNAPPNMIEYVSDGDEDGDVVRRGGRVSHTASHGVRRKSAHSKRRTAKSKHARAFKGY